MNSISFGRKMMIKLEIKTEGEEIKGSAELDRTNEKKLQWPSKC